MDVQYTSVCMDVQHVGMDALNGPMQTGLTDFDLVSTGCSLSWALARQRLYRASTPERRELCRYC